MSDNLIQENEDLKTKLTQHEQNFDGLTAQLDAHKQLLNEQLATSIQLRSTLVLFQRQIKELNEKNVGMQKMMDDIKAELVEANSKI